MNRLGIYYAYWARNWSADFHPYIDKVADLGFDQLEVHAGAVAAMNSAERRELKQHAESRGLTLSYCIGLTHSYDVASADAATRATGIAFLEQIIGAIGEIGGGSVGGILYGAWPASMPEGMPDKRPALERSIASIRQVAHAAEDSGVILNLEVVNRFEQYLLNTSAEAIEYVRAVGSPNVRLMLDTFHLNIEEDHIGAAIIAAGELLGHFHTGENNRMPPGHGHMPWDEIAAALRHINYQGAIVMEPFMQTGGEVGRDIRVYRDLSIGRDLDAEARAALQFTRDLLARHQ
ncbi:MAG TPA: sugar phosphate isomerase/epimerase family protein [Roseiflexaceae bacterium]|nr:sugar phosphate isomerase/epimerase family protein [Roseiflexaceae bacterium]HMP42462.1 sugar phosphate isomerase/epimerase family protein [Roseiflexaceae bacterium]